MHTSRRLRSAAVLLTASAFALAGCSDSQDELADPALTTVETSPAEEQAETTEAEQPSSEKKEKPTTKTDEDKDKDSNKDEKEEKKADEPTEDRSNVAAGTVCGEVTSLGDGSALSVAALDDGLDCNEAMEVFTDYMSDSPSGTPPQGSGAFWTAPNGWFCGGNNFLFPGDEDQKFNKYPSCGPKDSGKSVVAVPPERVSELPV
ncbi:hypothetical protein [Corynebacterium sp. Marseille-P3884]|uniref:hypothetical protein n=1 Tax=Corynebacterium sp. Marseille-P3884 TaxID=2495409 RepID=UPI001B337906|nr:hypothetical protein [Corynebacterium sp. Marseille-P3884]MBP3949401.1 hypothetical protein [Corynebacterium sp. Marseille-P3884]